MPLMAVALLHDVVYRRIKSLIVEGRFPLGSKLSESRLAETLQAGRAPVRDALKRLQAEKLVVRKPKSGTYVFTMNQTELDQMLHFRWLIESEAAKVALAAQPSQLMQELGAVVDMMRADCDSADLRDYLKQDSRFHLCIVTRSENRYFIAAFQLVAAIMDTVRNLLGNNREHLERSMRQHLQLIDAGRDRNAAAFADLLAEHILPAHGAYWTEEHLQGRLPAG